MTPQQIIEAAYKRLADEHDEDPRSELMQGLRQLINGAEPPPAGDIELTAVLQPGGACLVHDQHSRRVRGVKTVAVFEDQGGRPVFQVTL